MTFMHRGTVEQFHKYKHCYFGIKVMSSEAGSARVYTPSTNRPPRAGMYISYAVLFLLPSQNDPTGTAGVTKEVFPTLTPWGAIIF